jgi:hypothetical protein
MINNQKRLSILVTFILGLCLPLTGMRITDPARPHRPKPGQKAVVESQVKTSQHVVNKSIDLFAFMAKPIVLRTTLPYRMEFVFAFHTTEFPPLFPNSARAPPLFLS